jgi:hypothetical protein
VPLNLISTFLLIPLKHKYIVICWYPKYVYAFYHVHWDRFNTFKMNITNINTCTNLLTDFQTLKDNQFSLWYHSCIHNLQNKMHNFRFNNEIPNAKICLCAQLRSIWVRIKVLLWVHVIHFVQIDAFTVFVSVLWCPLWLPGEYDIRLFYSHCVLSIFYLCYL